MVILNKIYTKTGDDGTTALGSGERRQKYDLRVTSYGTVDETNASLGVARLHAEGQAMDQILERIQNDLFDLGADLCVPDDPEQGPEEREFEPLRITEKQVADLEGFIDESNARLEPLRSFILPGGTALAAHLHVARTIARRAERMVVELARTEGEIVNPFVVQYLNRLSDLLFVLARQANDCGKSDILWVPGKNR